MHHEVEHDFVTELRVLSVWVSNQNRGRQDLAIRLDEPVTSLANEVAGETSAASFDDFNHFANDGSLQRVAAFSAFSGFPRASATVTGTRGAASHDAASHPISADGITGPAGWDEQVSLPDGLIGADECESLHIDLDRAFRLVAVAWESDVLIRSDLDAFIFEETRDCELKDLGIIGRDLHLAFDLARGGRAVVVVGEVRENAPGKSRRHE